MAEGVAQAEAAYDVVAGEAVGRGRKGHDGCARVALLYHGERGVDRPEIMAPLRDAVRLVDGEEAYRHRRVPPLHIGEEAFGGNIKEFYLTGKDALHHLAVVSVGVVGVDCGGGNAVGLQGLHLIVHEGDEGRHDHRASLSGKERGHLIAHALASARRHKHDGVAAGGHGFDYAPLSGTESAVAVESPEQGQGLLIERAGGGRRSVFRFHKTKVRNFLKNLLYLC